MIQEPEVLGSAASLFDRLRVAGLMKKEVQIATSRRKAIY